MITVTEFIDLFVKPDTLKFQVWSNEKERVVFEGYISDYDFPFDTVGDAVITSIDNIDTAEYITLNIDKEV